MDFVSFKSRMRLPLAPVFMPTGVDAESQNEGVKEILSGWLTKYVPSLDCVLLGFDSVAFEGPVSHFDPDEQVSHDEPRDGTVPYQALRIIPGFGHQVGHVVWRGLGWRPQKGQKLTGQVALCSPSHVSIIVYNLFNASIPVSAMPEDDYTFDAEYTVPQHVQDTFESTGTLADLPQASGSHSNEKGWFCTHDGQPLGGKDGRVTFTVTDVALMNNMLSLTGTLYPDGTAGRKRKQHGDESRKKKSKGEKKK